MDDGQYTRPRQAPLPKHQNPPPVAVPRSQFANRPNAYHTTTTNPRPRNFSSPFRTPLDSKDRHQSFVDHHRSIANQNSNNAPAQPQQPQRPQRSSHALFETHVPNGPLPATRSSNQNPSSKELVHNGQQFSEHQYGVVRQASLGHKAKPALLHVKRSDSTRADKSYEEPRTPPAARAATIEALNNAIAAAVRNPAHRPTESSVSQNTTKTRMPFDSPTSTYSQDFRRNTKTQAQLGETDIGTEPLGRISSLDEDDRPVRDFDSRRLSPLPGTTPYSEKSATSTNPLLGLGIEQKGMATRVPQELQPPKLDIKAVRDMESRGSITSLPDLIRRATKLAANLDRGKTASRFGVWDMFTNFDHLNTKDRNSTLSDALDGFNGPDGDASRKPRPTTMWPTDFNQLGFASEKQASNPQKQRRTCCGLSIAMFIFVLVVLIVLIAAAILLPIFLVAVPKQHRASSTNLAYCSASHPCQNDGISVVDNNACSCICVDGFTGNDCSRPTDDNCATATILDSSRTYENATLGSSIVSLLQQAEGKMNIPLNATILLSVFANYNLSCASENSLVRFDTKTRRNQERFVIISDPSDHTQNAQIGEVEAATITARQNPVQTLNDVVYQSGAPTTTTSAISLASPTSTGVPATRANITANQLEFAGLVVLYILARSRVPSTAVVAQQNIEQYFRAGALASGNATVDVVYMDNMEITANFAQLAIILSDGKIIGGTSLNG